MELREFIKKTILEISDGIDDARMEGVEIHTGSYKKVKFNVSVTTSKEGEAKIGGGIFVASFGVGGSNKENSADAATTRIEFEIDMSYSKRIPKK